jgi:hypothetical protein
MSDLAAVIQCNGCNTRCHVNLLPVDTSNGQLIQRQRQAVKAWMQTANSCGKVPGEMPARTARQRRVPRMAA